MFFKRSPKPRASSGTDLLRELVQRELPELDEDTARIIVSVAGLLAGVAYADRVYGDAEQAYVRTALSGMDGVTSAGVDAICRVLKEHGQTIAVQNPQAFTRELRERVDIPLRLEVLEVLLELAAVDGELRLAETDLLRRTAAALGLSSADYQALQERHRDRLSVLREEPKP
jgi:uncharacterized tellurite resistance protein B-like protein